MELVHPFGGGVVEGDAEVSLAAYVGPYAAVRGNAEVYAGAFLEGLEDYPCVVQDRARVFGGHVVASTVGRRVVLAEQPRIEHSIVTCRSVSGQPLISSSYLRGKHVRVCDKAKIHRAILDGEVYVFWNAVLVGRDDEPPIAFDGPLRIHTGVWTRAPHWVPLEAPTAKLVQECAEGQVHVGCVCNTIPYFLENGELMAKDWGWSEEPIERVRAILKDWK
jgi:carbonic anhydrase/acetyltransferase-like protein (isoleucine patch superfamily)